MAAPTPPVTIGQYTIDPPVVLAPMAGITNVAYRRICREFGSPTALYVCEMITARAVVERDPTTMQMITFGADEHPPCAAALRRRPDHHAGSSQHHHK